MPSLFANAFAIGKRVATCVFASAVLCAVACAENFDQPSRRTVVDLGNAPGTMPPRSINLTCWYYHDFVIKQLDDPSLKGAAWVTVAPAGEGIHLPCRRPHEAGERYLGKDRTHYFGGYFKGVKDQLVFLDAADGMNGGISFIAYDWKSGRPIFQDTALFWDGQDLRNGPQDNVQFSRTSGGSLVLHYRRVVESTCSIPTEGMKCWTRVRRKFHLPPAAMPRCTGYRYPGMPDWTPENPIVNEGMDAPSAFAYPVETTLRSPPSSKSVPGRITCSAAD